MKCNEMRLHLCIIVFVVIGFTLVCGSFAQTHPSKKTVTSISTEFYEIHLQKNGTLKLFFSNGIEILSLKFPEVFYSDKEKPIILKYSGNSGYREPIKNSLGDGIGLFAQGENVNVGVEIYPSKTFITYRVRFVNNSKSDVSIKRIDMMKAVFSLVSPFDDAINSSVVVLGNGNIFSSTLDFPQWQNDLTIDTEWNVAVFRPFDNQISIFGFLTVDKAFNKLTINPNPKSKEVQLTISCIYDPPKVLAPGEMIDSEVLYLSFAEKDPIFALERYGRAIAVFNRLNKKYDFIPHGWDSWSTTLHREINEESILRNVEFVDNYLKRYGWTTIAIDAGWERGPADWEPHPLKFPAGFEPIVDEIHRRGMKACLWLDPFTVPVESYLAKEHPDWLVVPNAKGKLFLGENKRIIDVTLPQAYDYIKHLCAKITQKWKFDGLVEADFVYNLLLADQYKNRNLTKVEVFRLGLTAIQEGMGNEKFLMSMVPLFISGMYADGVRIGLDNKPVWSSGMMSGNFGCVESLTNFARRFYLFPHLGLPDQDCVFLGHDETYQRWKVTDQQRLTQSQVLSWITGTSLTGGVFKIGEEFSKLNQEEVNILRKVIPRIQQPARPVDLFEDPYPQIWYLPVSGPEINGTILGIFNWSSTHPQNIIVNLEKIGLSNQKLYALFDFWNEQFLGVSRGSFRVNLPPGNVSLFGLREIYNFPTFIASNHHITQGFLDVQKEIFDSTSNILQVQMKVIENTEYKVFIYVPNPWKFRSVDISVSQHEVEVGDNSVCISMYVPNSRNAVEWKMMFDKEK